MTMIPALEPRRGKTARSAWKTARQGSTQISFVTVNARTGLTEFELPLATGTPELILYDHSTVHSTLFTPEPAVTRDQALVCTNVGVFAAVNLRTRSLTWTRTYPRAPVILGQALSDALLARESVPPIIGAGTVLAALRDGMGLLLLDAATGRVLREQAAPARITCRRLGATACLVVDNTGNDRALSLKDLSPLFPVDGRITSVLQDTGAALVLLRNGCLEAWRDDGVRTAVSKPPVHRHPPPVF